jgi:hypothetical protein
VAGAQFLSRRHEPVVDAPPLPIQLIDGPGWCGGFLQGEDGGARGAGTLGEGVPRRRELIERQLIEPADFVVVGLDINR